MQKESAKLCLLSVLGKILLAQVYKLAGLFVILHGFEFVIFRSFVSCTYSRATLDNYKMILIANISNFILSN